MEQLQAISLSHRLAPVEVREQFHLIDAEIIRLHQSLKEVLGLQEALILSTCNRTEIYFSTSRKLAEQVIQMLCVQKGVCPAGKTRSWFQVMSDTDESVHHLFQVSMGLESMVIGDLQISNQVKTAYKLAVENEMAGPFLHRLMHTIFHTNKRVHQETPFRDGAASVSYAAAELAAELTSHHPEPSVLVVGMGEMGRDVARNLASRNFGRRVLCNRTLSKAEELASETQAELLEFEQLEEKLPEFDVVVSAISTQAPFFKKGHFQSDGFQSKFLIDLSVPRSVDPKVEQVPGILVYNVDEIRNKTREVVERRLKAVPQVEAIILEEFGQFKEWSRDMAISPTIKKLKEALNQIRQEEMARFLRNASEEEAKLLEKATKSMVNKILRLPVLQLKAACKRGEEESLTEALTDLFDLEKSRKKVK